MKCGFEAYRFAAADCLFFASSLLFWMELSLLGIMEMKSEGEIFPTICCIWMMA